MFSAIMPSPIFKDFSSPTHYPSVPSPLSSSPIRASSPPAPLSPRDRNAQPSRRQIQSSPIPAPKFKFASRPTRPNPVLRNRESFHQGRRELFLKGVQQRADDQRWERRGVESKLLSAEWFNLDQARRRAKDLDRDGIITDADIADAESLLEGRGAPSTRQELEPDDMMVDAMLREEEAEIESLIVSSAGAPQSSDSRRPDSPHWSDDEDYDALFMDLISGQENQPPFSSGDVEMS